MIRPLSPAHYVALGAFLLFAVLLFINVNLAPLPLILFVLLCGITPLFPRLSFFLPIISKGKMGTKGVALTFDDGPDPAVTPQLLDLLALHGVTATFFVTGARAARYPDIIRAILAGGHTIGNHSYSHSPFLMLRGLATLQSEIVSAQLVFQQFGIMPLVFRPPVGITNSRLWRVLLENGMFCVNFSCRAADFGNRRVTKLAGRLLAKVVPGDIILLHDVAPVKCNVEQLLNEFSTLIEGLKERGLEIIPLSRLIGREVMRFASDSTPTDFAEANGEPTKLKALVVIPVYNHVNTLREVTERALAEGFAVLVLDDGSTDGCLDSVADLPISRHRLPVNRGKGAAILAATQFARSAGYEAIVTIDADGQHDPADARLLLETAASSWPCIVIGARRMETLNVPRSSVFGRDFSNFWVWIECGQTLPDTQSGYRLYPVEFLESSRFLSRRYTFEIEVLVRGSWAGLPVLSVPVSVYYPPGDERVSHFHKFKDNLRLSCLHTFLVTRSLITWPHRRLFRDGGAAPAQSNPVEKAKAR